MVDFFKKKFLISIVIFLVIAECSPCQKDEWTGPDTAYLFAPGLWSSEHQAAKYCSEYCASTGQIVKGGHGHELINGRYTHSCNFAESIRQNEFVARVAEFVVANRSFYELFIYVGASDYNKKQ